MKNVPGPRRSLLPRFLVLVLLALPVIGGGCTAFLVAKVAKRALKAESSAAFTFQEGGVFEGMEEDFFKLFGVDGYVEKLETGARILRLEGQYEDLIQVLVHLLERGLALVASDEFSEGLLAVAVSLLKSGG